MTIPDEAQVNTGAAPGHEPPRGDAVRAAVRPYPASHHEVPIAISELDPEVALGLLLVPAREHPGPKHTRLLPGGIDAPCVSLQQERQQHVHRRRLAGTVHTTEQQTPTAELQGLIRVLVDVDDSCSLESPPPDHRRIVGAKERSRRSSIEGDRNLALTHNLGGYPGEMVSFVSILGADKD